MTTVRTDAWCRGHNSTSPTTHARHAVKSHAAPRPRAPSHTTPNVQAEKHCAAHAWTVAAVHRPLANAQCIAIMPACTEMNRVEDKVGETLHMVVHLPRLVVIKQGTKMSDAVKKTKNALAKSEAGGRARSAAQQQCRAPPRETSDKHNHGPNWREAGRDAPETKGLECKSFMGRNGPP